MRPRLCSSSRSRRIVISELKYFRASSRTRARPFWFTKSTMARRRSSFITELRLTGMVVTCVRIRSYSINSEVGNKKRLRVSRYKKQRQPSISRIGKLVDHHRFHQIAGTVDVEAVQKRNVVGKELQRHDFHDGQQQLFEAREVKRRDAHATHDLVALGGEQNLALGNLANVFDQGN